MTLYHCTWSNRLKQIMRQGLRVMQTSNWTKADTGERYGGGAIHAFTERMDAVRWAAKMEWELTNSIGTMGAVQIVHFDGSGQHWDNDYSDTLTRSSYAGQWLKTFEAVPASAIIKLEPLTQRLIHEFMEWRDRTQYQSTSGTSTSGTSTSDQSTTELNK